MTPEMYTAEKFAGFEFPHRYDQEDLVRATTYLRQIVEKHNVESPFFNFTDNRESRALHQFDNCGARYKIAPIGAFSEGEMAAIILEQSKTYVERGTMGAKFPKGNSDAEEELLAVFAGNFDQDRLYISVSSEDQERFKPVAGISVVINNSSKNLGNSPYGQDPSLIPTFDALSLTVNVPVLAELQEQDVACPTRYWCAEGGELSNLGIRDVRIAQKVVALIPFAYIGYQSRTDKRLSKYAVFDTHSQAIMDFTSKKFDAVLIADNGQVVSKNSVLDSILRYHYGDSDTGGFGGNICVGLFDTEVFLRKAYEFLCSHGIELANE